MLSLFALCVALCWTFGVSECDPGETEQTDAQGNTHCMKLLSTVLRSTNPGCSIEEQSLWINVAAQSNEIFYMNAVHWNATDATIGGNTITGLIQDRNIADGAITRAKLAPGAMPETEIIENSIGPFEIDSSTSDYFEMDRIKMNYIRSHNDAFALEKEDNMVIMTMRGNTNLNGGFNLVGGLRINDADTIPTTPNGVHLEVHGQTVFNGQINQMGQFYTTSTNYESDIRIKRDIQSLGDLESLSILRQLDAKSYYYKDVDKRGNRKVIGFIAQEVTEAIPTAVTLMTRFIPDELRHLKATFTPGEDSVEMTLSERLSPGMYRFVFTKADSTTTQKDLETNDGEKFMVGEEYNEDVFLYGRQVDDFHTIDKQRIFAVAYSALQQVDKNQQVLQDKVRDLEGTILELSSRLLKLENQ